MKPFTLATLVILTLLALAHALRLLLGVSIAVDGVDIPMWASVVGLVIAAGLAFGLWREAGFATTTGNGLTQDELRSLLNVNGGREFSMSGAMLRNAFPPGIGLKTPEGEKAWDQCAEFVGASGFDVIATGAPRSDTVTFRPKR